MDPDREIYPNGPLSLVAFELRYPLCPRFEGNEGKLAVYEALRELVPILGPAQQGIELPGVPGLPVEVGGGTSALRMLDRARTRSVTVGPTSLILETSAYERYETFEQLMRSALDAAGPAGDIAGIERVGLRYIDEVRVSGVSAPGDWEPYIAEELLGTLQLGSEFQVESIQGNAQFKISDRHRAVMRYGALQGAVVNPDGPLRIPTSGLGPFFLLDLDSFWTASEDDLPPFSTEEVMKIGVDLHSPVRQLFEASITDKLRNEVLRKGEV